jgi:dolichol-phosphate mannosyltransferase
LLGHELWFSRQFKSLHLYNEEKCFDIYVEAVERVLLSRPEVEYRCLLVDDGSTDRTWELIQQQCRSSPRFRGLRLSRNFGAHTAETAGLDVCDADAVAILSADLQDPPEVILSFVEAWRQGADVVFGRGRMREDPTWRALASKAFEALLRRFAMPSGSKFATGGFLLIDRKVVECVRRMREANRLIFALAAWTGFRQAVVEYDRQRRVAGRSAWSFAHMIKSMYDGLIGFSGTIPRVVTLLGAFFAVIGFIATLYFLLNAIFFRPPARLEHHNGGHVLVFWNGFSYSWHDLRYLLRIYVESTRRPLYFVAADTAADELHPRDGQRDEGRRTIHA